MANQNKIPLKTKENRNYPLIFTTLGFAIISIVSLYIIEASNAFTEARYDRIEGIIASVLKMDLPSDYGITLINALVTTLGLAFLATLFGVFLGIFCGLLCATNISNKRAATVVRAVNSVIRAIPTFIWVLLFIMVYGMNGTAAVVGMTFHSMSFFTKTFAETFEEVDAGSIEALRSTGATWLHIVFGAVLPSSIGKMVAWTAYRFEINFGVAVIVGPMAAVPNNIGTLLSEAAQAFRYSEIFVVVLVTFIVLFLLELLSNNLKGRMNV